MTKILKNILLTLGTVTILATPIIMVASCTETSSGTGGNSGNDNGNIVPPVDGGGDITPPPAQKLPINIIDKTDKISLNNGSGLIPQLSLGGGTANGFNNSSFKALENYKTDPDQIYSFKADIKIPMSEIEWILASPDGVVVRKYAIPEISRKISFNFKFDGNVNDSGKKAIFLVGDNPGYFEEELSRSPSTSSGIKQRSILTVPIVPGDNTFNMTKYSETTDPVTGVVTGRTDERQMQYQIALGFDEEQGLKLKFFPMSVEDIDWANDNENRIFQFGMYNNNANKEKFFQCTFSLTPKN